MEIRLTVDNISCVHDLDEFSKLIHYRNKAMNAKPPLSVRAVEVPETLSPTPLLLLEAAPVAEAEPGAPEESVTTPDAAGGLVELSLVSI